MRFGGAPRFAGESRATGNTRRLRRLERSPNRSRRSSKGTKAGAIASGRRSARFWRKPRCARGRRTHARPENDGLFTRWCCGAPRQRNTDGARYAREPKLAGRASDPVLKDVGTSDHALVVATFRNCGTHFPAAVLSAATPPRRVELPAVSARSLSGVPAPRPSCPADDSGRYRARTEQLNGTLLCRTAIKRPDTARDRVADADERPGPLGKPSRPT